MRRVLVGVSAPTAGILMAAEMAEQPGLADRFVSRRAQLQARLRAFLTPEPFGVCLLARGSSDNAALYGRYLLGLTTRLPVSLAVPSLWTRYQRSPDLRGWLVVALSQSGRTPEIADSLGRMSAAGARTMAITNDVHSRLAGTADLVIDLDAGPERAVPATKSVVLQMATLAVLAESLGDVPWSQAQWASVPDAIARGLSDTAPARHAADRIAQSAWSLHVGRGPLYAAAVEGALKLAETAARPALGFSSADFLHGPVAMATTASCLVAYTAAGPVERDTRAAAEAAAGGGAIIISISDRRPDHGLWVPIDGRPGEALAPLAAVIRGQQLAALVTKILGGDPDRPPQLRKVTPTD